jgi:quinol monooxygenase YgiN
MAFVQIIEFKSSDIEGIRKAGEDWERKTEGKRTARRQLLARDRTDPGRYFMIVFFDSYESAMANSELPETQASSQVFADLADGPPVFRDLDIIEDRL